MTFSNDEIACIALALDWKHPLNYKSVPILVDDGEEFDSDFTPADFINFVKNGDKIDDIIDYVDISKWNNFYRKILTNDFDWFTPITIPRNVPIFQPQRASKTKTLSSGMVIEPIISGTRSFLKIGVEPQAYNKFMLPSTFDISMLGDFDTNFIIDGVANGDGFHAFDLLPYDDFINGNCPLPQVERKDALNQMIGLFQKTDCNIAIVESMVSVGDETNVIVKDQDAPYISGENKHWLKYDIQ